MAAVTSTIVCADGAAFSLCDPSLTIGKTRLEYSVEKPLNREPPLQQLISKYITKEGNFDRNHGPIPHIESDSHSIRINGLVERCITLGVDDLRAYPQHLVLCVVQCAGNRRHTMRTQLREVSGVDWLDGAAMNCLWRGPRLRDVLSAAGLAKSKQGYDGLHVQFASHITACQEDGWYGASIPLARAMAAADHVIVALEMNGKPLTPAHGAPVRMIVPGIAGARSVKWLDTITVQDHESTNFYQQRDYKILPPHCRDKLMVDQWWCKIPALMEMPVNSVVGFPGSGDRVQMNQDGSTDVRGYALPGGDNGPVQKVEVSADDGETWVEADLLRPPAAVIEAGLELKWAWSLWRARVKIPKGRTRIWSRASDRQDVQPRYPAWNWRGLAYNGYGEAADLTAEEDIKASL